jgi:2-succinyl-6-hydroxy-2,4-cyclohexadiene-1-carboxylate synthase
VTLHAVQDGAGPPVILLHGFTGCADTMAGVAAGLRSGYRTLCIDLVGHGASDAPHDLSAYRMERCVDQVADVVLALVGGPAHFIGYSMGGRVALALCARRPELAASALVVGARAGFEDARERAARVGRDEALADRIEREGVEPFVDSWLALPLFASQRRLGSAALAEARTQRLANRAHGLALSLRGMGAGAQPPLHDQLGRLRMPVCLVAGEEDPLFLAISRDLSGRIPGARFEVVPAAGHAAHVENTAAFLRIAERFLAEASADIKPTQTTPQPLPAQIERTPAP